MDLLERDWRFEDPISALSNLYGFIYYFIARQVLDDFGERGEQSLRTALVNYGHFRGKLLRERHIRDGIDINVKNFAEHYDLPTDKRTTKNRKLMTETESYGENTTCQFSDIWKFLEGLAPDADSLIGRIYCEAFHQAMCEGYCPTMKIDMPKILACGDDRCVFHTTMTRECPKA